MYGFGIEDDIESCKSVCADCWLVFNPFICIQTWQHRPNRKRLCHNGIQHILSRFILGVTYMNLCIIRKPRNGSYQYLGRYNKFVQFWLQTRVVSTKAKTLFVRDTLKIFKFVYLCICLAKGILSICVLSDWSAHVGWWYSGWICVCDPNMLN